jgi:hypothetical protein
MQEPAATHAGSKGGREMNEREIELLLDGLEKEHAQTIAFWTARCDELLQLVDNYRVLAQDSLTRVASLTRRLEDAQIRERQLRGELREEQAR